MDIDINVRKRKHTRLISIIGMEDCGCCLMEMV